MSSFAGAPRGPAAASINPRDADRAFAAGLEALKRGTEKEALRLLERSTRFHPGDARLWQVTGLLHRSLDDLAPSVKALTRAAALARGDAKIAHTLARARLEAGLPSVEAFEAAHRMAPLDGDVILGLTAARVADGNPDAAIGGIDEQLVRHPGWLPGHSLMARLLWMFGERAGFTRSYERALASAPGDINLWREYIITLVNGDLYEQALPVIARGRAAAGPHLVFDANEAVCAAELGRTEEAGRLFSALEPIRDVTLLIRRVRHLLRTGRPADAFAAAQPALGSEHAPLFWPYVATAWRMTDDPRWHWLEGQPGLVGVHDLKLPSLDGLARRLRTLHVAPGQPLEQSVRGGTQTDGPLFSRIEPEIRALRKAVVAAVERHIEGLPPPDPRHPTLLARHGRVRFAGSWSVRLLGQGHHANHIHPRGWFSSALYVTVPSEEEGGPPPAGHLTLGAPQAQLGVDLSPFRTVEPKPGRLVLFPSTMWHGTMPIEGGERMTVAFDVAPPR